ncbi:MAG: hypothetical protein M1817_003548 [Caeruleum heppii]|nr:MAG: hypothetical protein M1817_003548 [Caeruleum heppii]
MDLDHLITHLLAEIALCGEKGATVTDFVGYVHAFYPQQSQTLSSIPANDVSDPSVHVEETSSRASPQEISCDASVVDHQEAVALKPVVDHPFIARVWQWLTTHRDVSLENAGDQKTITFDEAQALDGRRAADASNVANAPDDESKPEKVRVRASQDRIWTALTGHGMDWARVPRFEFNLLTAIASYGAKGVTQPELGRVTGQDKRSLPKRTDMLHSKGYIVKRPIFIKNFRTSHLVLRRLAGSTIPDQDDASAATHEKEDPPEQRPWTGSSMDVIAVLRATFEELKRTPIITYNDLKKNLGIFYLPWQANMFARSIRKLEYSGYVKRTYAASMYSFGDHVHRCVKLIREPLPHEWEVLWDRNKELFRNDAVQTNDNSKADAGEEEDDEIVTAGADRDNVGAIKELQEVARILPQWRPEKPIANQLFDLIHASGLQGSSTMSLKTRCVGSAYRRPLETALDRLTLNFRVSQPRHLWHLGIIKDTAQVNKTSHFQYYTYDHFSTLVATGKTTWNEILIPEDSSGGKAKALGGKPSDAEASAPTADLDLPGFLVIPKKCFFRANGNSTLSESVRSIRPEPLIVSGKDPVIVRGPDGRESISWTNRVSTKAASRAVPASNAVKRKYTQTNQDAPTRPLGRPRKYAPGREIYKPEVKKQMKLEKQQKQAEAAQRRKAKKSADAAARHHGTSAGALNIHEQNPAADVRAVDEVAVSEQGQAMPQGGVADGQTDGDHALLESACLPESVDPVYLSTPQSSGVDHAPGSTTRDAILVQSSPVSKDGRPLVLINPPGLERSCPKRRGRKKSLVVVFRLDASKLGSLCQETVQDKEGDQKIEESSPAKGPKSSDMVGVGDAFTGRKRSRDASPHEGALENQCVANETTVVPQVSDHSELVARPVRKKRMTEKNRLLNEDGQLLPGFTKLVDDVHDDTANPEAITTAMDVDEPRVDDVMPLSAETGDVEMLRTSAGAAPGPINEDDISKFDTTVASAEEGPEQPEVDITQEEAAQASVNDESNRISPVPEANQRELDERTQADASLIFSLADELNLATGSTSPIADVALQPSQSAEENLRSAVSPSPSCSQRNIATPSGTSKSIDPPMTPQTGKRIKRDARYKGQSIRGKGSLLYKRKKVILDLVEKCGGILPGDRDLWYPYAMIWMQENPASGRPDLRTLQNTQKALLDADHLKAVTFFVKTKNGLQFKKKILTTPEILPSDARVLDLQKKMVDALGEPVIPPQVELPDAWKKRLDWNLRGPYGESTASAERETVDEEVQLQHRPANAYLISRREQPFAEEEARVALRYERRELDMRHTTYSEEGTVAGPSWSKSGPRGPPRAARLHDLGKQPLRQSDAVGPTQSRNSHPRTGWVAQAVANALADDRARNHISSVEQEQGPSARQSPEDLTTAQTGPIWKFKGYRRAVPKGATTKLTPFSEPAPSDATWDSLQGRLYYSVNTFPRLWTSQQRKLNAHGRRRRLNGVHNLTDPIQPLHKTTWTFGTIFPPNSGKNWLTGAPHVPISVDQNMTLEKIVALGWGPRPRQGSRWDLETQESRFDYEVLQVREWEKRQAILFGKDERQSGFISHSVQSLPTAENRAIHPLVWGGEDPEVEAKHHLEVWGTDQIAAKTGGRAPVTPQKRKRNATTPGSEKIKKTPRIMPKPDGTIQPGLMPVSTPPPAPKPSPLPKVQSVPKPKPLPRPKPKARPLFSAPPQKRLEGVAASHGGQQEGVAVPDGVGRIRVRGPRIARAKLFTEADDRRLVIAVIVVRTLTGGVARLIDFFLVNEALPQFEYMTLSRRWNDIRVSFKMQLERLQSEFQLAFLRAYEAGRIPYLDYDHLGDYDWSALVDWAQQKLELAGTKTLPDLPATRKQMKEYYEVRDMHDNAASWREEFFSTTVALFRRLDVAAVKACAVPLDKEEVQPDEMAQLARSLVRANSLADEATYRPQQAAQRLRMVGETAITAAVETLRAKSVLVHVNKGREVPGRPFDITEYFLGSFKRTLSPTHLMRAAATKMEIDTAIARDGRARLSANADDGQILATINLAAHGRVRLVSRNIQGDRFGLMDGDYKTRFMDKARLYFDIDVMPTSSYVHGNPLEPFRPPPCRTPDESSLPVPVWSDILGHFIPSMWRKCVTAVMSLLLTRPGLSMKELERCLGPSLERWDLELLLGWLADGGVTTQVEGGWTLGEWWWMCMPEDWNGCGFL